jgi:hypothetical protein
MVAVLSAYFDESGGSDSKSPLTCSAAYLFREKGLREFFEEWEPYVRRKRLKHKDHYCFHAVEHCKRSDNAEIFSKLRNLISRTSEKGFVRFALNETLNEFNVKSDLKGMSGDNYSLLTLACMRASAKLGHSAPRERCSAAE